MPRFRGGLHGGPVTGGELRLEEYAKRMGLGLVVSGPLLSRDAAA